MNCLVFLAQYHLHYTQINAYTLKSPSFIKQRGSDFISLNSVAEQEAQCLYTRTTDSINTVCDWFVFFGQHDYDYGDDDGENDYDNDDDEATTSLQQK